MAAKTNYYNILRGLLKIKLKGHGIDIDSVPRYFKIAIIELHCMIEEAMERVLDKYIFGDSNNLDIKFTLQKLNLYGIPFGKKIEIINMILKKHASSGIKINSKLLNFVNVLRNYVAHDYVINKNSGKLVYKGKKLISLECFNGFVNDCFSLMSSLCELERIAIKDKEFSLYARLLSR
jgi:hypothetical protein